MICIRLPEKTLSPCLGFLLLLTPCFGSLDHGLVLYYSFDQDEGVMVTDKSGTGNTGQVHGATHTSAGMIGGAYEFDGMDDYISIKGNNSFRLRDNTVAAWVKSVDYAVMGQGIFNTLARDRSKGHIGFEVSLHTLGYGTHPSGVSTHAKVFSTADDGTWHHVAATYSFQSGSSTIKLYLDGALVKTDSYRGGPPRYAGQTAYVGVNVDSRTAFGNGGEREFEGTMDELRIYNRTLSADEIERLTETLRPFVAYNDLSWGRGQLLDNVTRYTTEEGSGTPPDGYKGRLLDHETGRELVAELSVTGGTWDGNRHVGYGGLSLPGTDGYLVFNGHVDATGVISYGRSDVVLSFSHLAPELRYTVTLFGNRDKPDYVDRVTRATISGVQHFINESTLGASFANRFDESVSIPNGFNSKDGYVTRFTDINPGSDGSFVVTLSDGESSIPSKHYVNALRIEGKPAQLRSITEVGFSNKPNGEQDTTEFLSDETLYINVRDIDLDKESASILVQALLHQGRVSTQQELTRDATGIFSAAVRLDEFEWGEVGVVLLAHESESRFQLSRQSSIWMVPPINLKEGLVLYYGFDADEVDRAMDASEHENHGVISGAQWSPAGKLGGCMLFDGIDDSIRASRSSSLDVGSKFTLAAWFKVSSYSLQRPIIEWFEPVNRSGVHMWVNVKGFQWRSLGTGANLVDTGGDEVNNVISISDPTLNEWHHMAITYDGLTGEAQLYFNGELSKRENLGRFVPQTTYDLYIGDRPSQPDAQWHGLLDEVRIYNRVLTAQEIAGLFTLEL